MKFEWEASLRDHVHKTPTASTNSLKESAASMPLQKVSKGESNTSQLMGNDGPMSPVKLTKAQMLAIKQREEIVALKDAFDNHLKITDKISRQSRRKKALREFDRNQSSRGRVYQSASDKIKRTYSFR